MVAELQFAEKYNEKIQTATIHISADVKFLLYINNRYVGTGPVCPGGDYANTLPMPQHYFNTYEIAVDSNEFHVDVQMVKNIINQCDMSQGRPGMIFSAELLFADGSRKTVVSNQQWHARVNKQRYASNITDYTLENGRFEQVAEVTDSRMLEKSPIKELCEECVKPIDFEAIIVNPKSSKTVILDFDKIYSCYYALKVRTGEAYSIRILGYEKSADDPSGVEMITAKSPMKFRSLSLTSVGAVELEIHNDGNETLEISDFSLIFSHYPSEGEGSFTCSDDVLNKIYEMGKHALKICKQSVELDSPRHCENLGCTGDYLIASRMNYFTHSDTELTRFDIVRTANYLRMTKGFMFHTSYSLMWIMMLYDYYMFTADEKILEEVEDACVSVLERFHSYTDERGILSSPPNYMFLDWLEVDGLSMHHPPAALGQASLNAFYYGALRLAIQLFEIQNQCQIAEKYISRAAKLKQAFQECFFDREKQLYFDGLNEKYVPNEWLPENTDRRYYSWHTNSLAVLFDLVPLCEQKEWMERTLNDKTSITPQPYFMHFVLEAIYKVGLFEKYGMDQLLRWTDMIKFEKGLQEGWFAMPGYDFDYSHVWGGTPTYQLPSKIMGFEMVEPGFKKVRFTPNLFGLSYAKITMPTPFGDIKVSLESGKEPQISVPDGILVVK